MKLSDCVAALLLSVLASSVSADTEAAPQQPMVFKLEMFKTGGSYVMLEMNGRLGQATLYNNITNSNFKMEAFHVRLLPRSIESDGTVITEVSYTAQEKGQVVESTQIVKIKHGDTASIYAASPAMEQVRLSLAN